MRDGTSQSSTSCIRTSRRHIRRRCGDSTSTGSSTTIKQLVPALVSVVVRGRVALVIEVVVVAVVVVCDS